MKKILLLFLLIFIFAIPALRDDSEGFGECAQNCESCHNIVESEASCILDCVDLKEENIKDISMVRTAGLWKVLVEKDGAKKTYFIDFGKKNVFVGEMRSAEAHADHADQWEKKDSELFPNEGKSPDILDLFPGMRD